MRGLFAAVLAGIMLSSVAVAAPQEDGSLKSMLPVVVNTLPKPGDTAVDPSLKEIRVTFSKDMQTNKMWAWVMESKESFPKTTGEPRFLEDNRTCVLPVKLEPGKTYKIWINSGKFNYFRDTNNNSAVPYLLEFQTKR